MVSPVKPSTRIVGRCRDSLTRRKIGKYYKSYVSLDKTLGAGVAGRANIWSGS